MFNTITVLRIKISSYKFQHCGHVESVRKLKSVRCLAVYLAMELRNFSSSCSCLKARTPKTMLFFWFVTPCRYKERRLILRFFDWLGVRLTRRPDDGRRPSSPPKRRSVSTRRQASSYFRKLCLVIQAVDPRM
jgi:hypothetical protein